MTHANAPLTPVGRLRLARLVVDVAGRCGEQPSGLVLTGHCSQVGGPLSGRSTDERQLVPSVVEPAPVSSPPGATHHRAAVHPALGPAPDRIPPGRAPLDRRARSGPLPDAAADPPGPEHRTAGPASCASALGSRRPRRGRHSSLDQALPAADQRQGRALQPHPGQRGGLRLHVPVRRSPRGHLRRLAALRQPPPTPHRHRWPLTRGPRPQPHGELQLADYVSAHHPRQTSTLVISLSEAGCPIVAS